MCCEDLLYELDVLIKTARIMTIHWILAAH